VSDLNLNAGDDITLDGDVVGRDFDRPSQRRAAMGSPAD